MVCIFVVFEASCVYLIPITAPSLSLRRLAQVFSLEGFGSDGTGVVRTMSDLVVEVELFIPCNVLFHLLIVVLSIEVSLLLTSVAVVLTSLAISDVGAAIIL